MQDRNNTDNSYDDIINHPHHVSTRHPRMSMIDRAAQFSPFAALTGYGDVIKETARLTDRKPELSESEKAELDYKLQMACDYPGVNALLDCHDLALSCCREIARISVMECSL